MRDFRKRLAISIAVVPGLLINISKSRENVMPAKSKSQQKAAGAALAAKRGDAPVSDLRGASKQMEKSMSEKELKEMASTKRKGKPDHKSKS